MRFRGTPLKIEIFDEHKSYAFGRIVEIITPSPKRIEPACKHFGICGGCGYLNMPYEEEIYWKTEIFKTEFKKTFKNTVNIDDVYITINTADQNYLNYRQKIGLKIYPPYIGFYKKLTHHVIDVEYCFLAQESINEMLKNVRNLLSDKTYKDTILDRITKVTLADAGIKNIIFSFKNHAPALKQFAEDAIKNTGADNIFFELRGKKTVKYTRAEEIDTAQNTGNSRDDYFTVKDKKFSYDLPTFIQVNKKQNENIITAVTEYLKNITAERGRNFINALDLYCGYGNITLFLAPFADNITGVESSDFSVKLGEKNLILNDIKNIKFIESDVAGYLDKADAGKNKKTCDLIVLDPPRAGVKGLAAKIASINAECIIYISCDTMTLLRDLKVFAETGYKIERVNLTDMFPRTYHMEHIAFLRK
ncbi:MAG: 23S rRNA (uracil(1939)-C(5))-methyltransferase RlmD [Deltaproteobacteria bacterium]|nr:23S rRNA (uracil(1939)-C(5))-methyltransferase RlmD [Deltaproteobacteria bacterium]